MTHSSGNGTPLSLADDPVDGSGAIVESLYSGLRKAIVECEIPPDAVISQVRLAKQFGVSRTPLREVLRLLEREGLVKTRHNRQVRIAGYSLQDLEEVYVTRIALEPVVASSWSASIPASRVEELTERLDEMAEAASCADVTTWNIAHRRFHELLAVPSSQRIRGMLAQLADHADRYRRIYATTGQLSWSNAIRHHQEILDAVRRREPELTSYVLARHIAQAGLILISAADPTYDAALIRRALRIALAESRDRG